MSKKSLILQCDKLCKQIAYILCKGRCEKCGSKVDLDNCDPHHIITKNMASRWLIGKKKVGEIRLPENISILHRKCHTEMHGKPKCAEMFYRDKIGDKKYDEINQLRPNYEFCEMWLEDLKLELKYIFNELEEK